MGDTSRRRGSMHDILDDDLPPYTDRGRYREYSDLPHNNISRHRDHSRWSSGEKKDGSILKDKIDIAETREQLCNSSHYRSMSPGIDGLEQQKWSNAPDKRWSQSRRYGESRRSRSRSRSRSRGLENNISRSPGWSRSRSRVRDRSRSRSRGSLRGNSRSRSPFYDQGPESHRWSDRKSERGRSSQTCKDFVTGMCRRGSQCRFLHSDNVRRDDEPLDSDIDGRRKYKQEPGHGSKYHYDKAVDEFSDSYHRNNESSQSRSRGSVTCRDFVKGNCRYGESCRFSHSAENDNVDRSFRNVPGHGHNSNEAGRSLCKFFLAGNCRRDNCRFSHDTPLSSEHEDRMHDNIGGGTVVTLDKWKPPLRSESEKPANTRRISRWGASVDAHMDLSDDVFVGRRGDERLGFSLDDETKAWEHNDNSLNRDYRANNRTHDEDNRHIFSAKAMGIEKSFGEPQQTLTYEYPRSPSVDEMSPHMPSHNLGGEAAQHYLSPPPANPQVFITSGTHQYQGVSEHSRGPVLKSNVLYEHSNRQGVDPEIRSAYRDNSSVLNMEGQQMMSPTSNALKVDLNEFGHGGFSSNVNDQINRGQSTIQNMPEPGAYSSFPVQARNDQFAPLNTFPVSVSNDQNIQTAHVAKSFLDELKTQLHTVSQQATLMATAPPQNISNPPLLKNDTIAVNDQMARELLSSLSAINPQLSTLHQSGDLKVGGNDDSKENHHEATKELETNDNGGKLNMNSKIEADNNCSNIGEEQGKEGGNNHKDEKVTRLFKNALVDLVKDILKPKWKEGKMSREVHKNVVKKTVDKVTVTIQPEHVPKTQEKVEQYLSSNRPKISKLVQAYVERSLKAAS